MIEPVDQDEVLRTYARFLRGTYAIATRTKGGDFEDWWHDWTQANWELLVEASAPWVEGVRLRVSGVGAEVHAPSSRVTLPDAQETHRVVCVPREGGFENLLDPGAEVPARVLELDRFVALEGTWSHGGGILPAWSARVWYPIGRAPVGTDSRRWSVSLQRPAHCDALAQAVSTPMTPPARQLGPP